MSRWYRFDTTHLHRYPRGVTIRPATIRVVDEPTTTVVIPPGWVARLDDQRNFHLQRDREAA
jgi:N-methylhydantoinase A/oxoprolinase/acetone carboxylase beta subunit